MLRRAVSGHAQAARVRPWTTPAPCYVCRRARPVRLVRALCAALMEVDLPVPFHSAAGPMRNDRPLGACRKSWQTALNRVRLVLESSERSMT